MKNKDNLNENIFAQIAKLLALPTIQRELNKAKHMVGEDDSLTKIFDDLKTGYANLKEKLPGFCKRNPDSPMCKDKKKD